MRSASAFPYEMEDWMKRSYCLLQELSYPTFVNKDMDKSLKKYEIFSVMSTHRSPVKNARSTARHSSARTPPKSAGGWAKRSMNRFSTPPQAPAASSRAP